MNMNRLTYLLLCFVGISCHSHWDMPLKVKFIHLCPDSTTFNFVLETSSTPGILYSGLQYPNSTNTIEKTLSLGNQEPITFHLEKNGNHNTLLKWGNDVSFKGTIIIGGTIDSLQSCIVHPLSNTYLGDTTVFNFVNAVTNSVLYDLKLGNKFLFRNKVFFTRDSHLDSSCIITKFNKTDTLQVYKSGTSQIVAYLPYESLKSNRNCTITISGIEGATDFKKLRVSLFSNNE